MNQCAPAAVNAEVRVAGHFGELLQGRLGPCGPVALVTLPCPRFVTRVRFCPGSGPLRSAEAVSAKARRAAALALAALGRPAGGRLEVARPVPPGLGAGSSTAEALGAIRAVAVSHGVGFPAPEEARLCLAAEGAVDPLMHDGPVLFASREARVLDLLPPMPAMAVAGGFSGPPRATDPADLAFADIGPLAGALRRAMTAGDLAAVAAVAEASAALAQARSPKPAWEVVGEIGEATGALGRVVSHSGAAIGLIYGALPAGIERRLEAAGLRHVTAWTAEAAGPIPRA